MNVSFKENDTMREFRIDYVEFATMLKPEIVMKDVLKYRGFDFTKPIIQSHDMITDECVFRQKKK